MSLKAKSTPKTKPASNHYTHTVLIATTVPDVHYKCTYTVETPLSAAEVGALIRDALKAKKMQSSLVRSTQSTKLSATRSS